LSNQHSRKRKQVKKQKADPRREVAKTLQEANAMRPRVTLLSIGLAILAMFLVLVLMVSVHMSRLQAESKARAAARMEKIEPVRETTTKIESSTWEIRRWGTRNQHRLPENLSVALDDNADAWGKPMRIEHEGTPVTEYKITSAGEDGDFATQDDVAIRFNIDHEQIERINTYGLTEMEAEMDVMMNAMGIDVQDD
jgi:hypothetical protein